MSLRIGPAPWSEREDAAVLGGCWVSSTAPSRSPIWPRQRLRAPVLGQNAGLEECWWVPAGAATAQPVRCGHGDGLHWRRIGDLLFGVIEIDEQPATETAPAIGLRQAAFDAYSRIFRLLDEQRLPHLWRLWNYMAAITDDGDGLERYREFNMGRGDAFEAGARSVVGRVPAACALGVACGPLTVAFLAGATATVPIENPRQVSAYLYPDRYGPRSPTFSRAALAYPPGQEILFVSGTASIVGHQSLHAGDVQAQTRESLDNIEAVLQVASARARSGPFGLADLRYRAYVRHAADLQAIQTVVAERVGPAAVHYVQADVCRRELLVELEAEVIRDLPAHGAAATPVAQA